jgi:16S rRNA (cytidine1402-2'-O)-methyltransferase
LPASDSPTDPIASTLYLVATPIGNLEDITLRALRILKSVDLIAAEDTRHTGKLLQHLQVRTPQISYHEHNTRKRIPELLTHLHSGKTLALVTDAGMPGISDPGYELVAACAEAKLRVVPIPGASAVITALAASGLSCDRFTFEGFLSAKGKTRRIHLSELQQEKRTIVLYESPHRLLKTLEDLQTHLGASRPITLARELTKRYEEFWRGNLATALDHYSQHEPKGEFTLVIAGAEPTAEAITETDLTIALQQLIAQGLSPSQASRQLAQETGLPRRDIYQLTLNSEEEEEEE